MTVSMIAAVGKNLEIGKNNRLLWRLEGDLPFFKKTTLGKSVIMGRKTFESLPAALPGRKNIVLSRSGFSADGVITADTPEKALEAAGEGEVFIIGGESIYRLFLDRAHRLYLTEAQAQDSTADAYFPEFSPTLWNKSVIDCGGGEIKYIHALYEKK